MNDAELINAVHSSMYHQYQHRGYAAPVDVLMDIGVLPKKKYEDWRFGKSGNPEIERWYATHFVDLKRSAQLKAEAAKQKEQDTDTKEQS